MLILQLCLGSWVPKSRAEEPPDPADFGQPPEFPAGQGPGPGFSEEKKKDDDDGVSLGMTLSLLAYSAEAAGLVYSAVTLRPALRRTGDALRLFFGSQQAKEKLGNLAKAMQGLDKAEPKALGEIEAAHVAYQEVAAHLAAQIRKLPTGEPTASLATADLAWSAHVKGLLELGLLRSNSKLKAEAAPLVDAWTAENPAALEAWLNRKEIREHRLFTTGPGQKWLGEFRRLQGHYGLHWWLERHTTVPLDHWLAGEFPVSQNAKTYQQLRNDEAKASVNYAKALQSVADRAAAYTTDADLQARLKKDAKIRVPEAETFSFATAFDPERSSRQPGEFALFRPDGFSKPVSAAEAKTGAEQSCRIAFRRAHAGAKMVTERNRSLPRRLLFPAITIGTGIPGGIRVGEGAWHFILQPLRKSVLTPSDPKPSENP